MNYFYRHCIHQTDSIVKHSYDYRMGGVLNKNYFLLKTNISVEGIFSKLEIIEVIFPSVNYMFCKKSKTGKISTIQNHFLSHFRLFDTIQEAETYAKVLKQYCIENLEKTIKWRQESLESMKLINP